MSAPSPATMPPATMPVGEGPILIAKPRVVGEPGGWSVVVEFAERQIVEPWSEWFGALDRARYLASAYAYLAPEPGERWERVPGVSPVLLRSVPIEQGRHRAPHELHEPQVPR